MPNNPGLLVIGALISAGKAINRGTKEKESKRLAAEKKLTASFRSTNAAAAKAKRRQAVSTKKSKALTPAQKRQRVVEKKTGTKSFIDRFRQVAKLAKKK